MLRDFISVNYKLEVAYDREEQDSLLKRGSDGILNKISSSYGVLTNIVRSKCIVVLTGKENDIKPAQEELKSYLYGGNGISVIKVFTPTEVLGTLIGKGGSNLKKLEKEYHPVTLSVMRTSKRICIRGPEEKVHQCRGQIVKTMMTHQILETLQLEEMCFDKLSLPAVKRKIFQGLSAEQLVLREGVARIRGTYFDVQELKFQLEEVLTDEYKTVVRLESSQYETVKNQLELEQLSDTTGARLEIDQSMGGILITGKRASVKRAKSYLLGSLESFLPRSFCRVKVLKPLVKSLRRDKRLADIAAESGCSLSVDPDFNCLIIQNSTVSDTTKGVTAVKALLKTYEELNYVLTIDRSDAWLINSFIDQGGHTIKNIEKETGCDVQLWRDELLLSASGNQKDSVQKAKDIILTIVVKAKKENVFVDLPKAALGEFIGRAGSHLSNFSKTHNVRIQRMKKQATLKISGEERAVTIAVSRVSDWLNGWENRNPGVVINQSEKIIARLADYPLFLKEIEQKYSVKIEIDRSLASITIRGDDPIINNEVGEKIRALIADINETQESIKNADAVEDSVNEAEDKLPDIGKENGHKNYDSVPSGVTVKNTSQQGKDKKPNSVPSGVTVMNTSQKGKDKKPSGVSRELTLIFNQNSISFSPNSFLFLQQSNSNVSSLLNLLITSDEASDNSDENWDSSTVSSTTDVFPFTESLSTNNASYFKSKSGFSVRL